MSDSDALLLLLKAVNGEFQLFTGQIKTQNPCDGDGLLLPRSSLFPRYLIRLWDSSYLSLFETCLDSIMNKRARIDDSNKAVVNVWKREVGELSTRNFAHRLGALEVLRTG